MIHIEVRKKKVDARQRGVLIKDISVTYGYSESTINRLLRKERETGDMAPCTWFANMSWAISSPKRSALATAVALPTVA